MRWAETRCHAVDILRGGGGRQVNKSGTSDKDACCREELGDETESSVRDGFPRKVGFRGPNC